MVPLAQLALTFLKIGALGFGGPFSLIAIMQKETVERHKWMTADEFTHSVGIGTLTPGPIFFGAAVFIGYRLRGFPGAITVGLCTLLPSFVLVVVISALYTQVEASPVVIATVQGIAAGVIGLFASVVLKTGRSTINDLRSVAFVVVIFAALAFFRMDPLVLIVASALTGAWLLRPSQQLKKTED